MTTVQALFNVVLVLFIVTTMLTAGLMTTLDTVITKRRASGSV
jgi:hypothetical protein